MPTNCTMSRLSAVPYCFGRQENDGAFSTQQFTRERFQRCKSLYRKDMTGHYGCVNAIEFSNNGGELLVSGGDDRRVLLWNIEKTISDFGRPTILKGEHNSNIFCLAFSSTNSKIFSSGNDEQVVVHDTQSGETLDIFLHEETVYGLTADPVNDNVFASACDDGRVLIWDIRERSGQEPFVLANYTSAFHAVMFNPVEPRLLATASSKEGVGLWDIRAPRSCLMRYGGSISQQSAMSVKFNSSGDRLVALRRRLPPVLYDIKNAVPLLQFDHSGYYNSCTMKSCCFGGDRDQYVLSGSDDFNLYIWKIPDESLEVPWVSEAHMVLKGHRSIVNQVRFNPATHLVATSGVEKVIKMWSPFKLPGGKGNITGLPDPEEERNMYSHEEYIDLVLNSGQGLSHDYTNHSTSEDPRMIAFFDSLVQREVEGWSSLSDSDDSLLSAEGFYYMQLMERDGNDSASDSPDSDSDSDRPWHQLRVDIDSDENTEFTPGSGSRQLFNLDDQPQSNSHNRESVERSRSSGGQQTRAGTSERTVREGIHSLTSAFRRTRNLSGQETRDTSSDSDQDSPSTDSRSGTGSSPRNPRQTRQRCWLRSDSDSNSSSRLLSSGPHLDHDRLISLRQRIACRRALREKLKRRNAHRNQQQGETSDEGDGDTQARLQIVTSQRSAMSSDRRSIRLLRRRIYDEDGDGSEAGSENVPTISGVDGMSESNTQQRDGAGETNDNNFDNFVSVATQLLKRTSPQNEDSNDSLPSPQSHKKQKVGADSAESNNRTKTAAGLNHWTSSTCRTESNVKMSTNSDEIDFTSLLQEAHHSATDCTTTYNTSNSASQSSTSMSKNLNVSNSSTLNHVALSKSNSSTSKNLDLPSSSASNHITLSSSCTSTSGTSNRLSMPSSSTSNRVTLPSSSTCSTSNHLNTPSSTQSSSSTSGTSNHLNTPTSTQSSSSTSSTSKHLNMPSSSASNNLTLASSSSHTTGPLDSTHSTNRCNNGDGATMSATNGNNTSNGSNWKEFCRFKNRLARSRRNYRKNSESKDDNGALDSDE